MRLIQVLVKRFFARFRSQDQSGAALVVTLLVMMVMILLALSLVIQSNTEQMISVNEQDAYQALANAEAALDWADRRIRNWIEAQDPQPTTLTAILTGDVGSNKPNHILGFRTTFDSTVTRFTLTDALEETTSGLHTDANGVEWEVFRMGHDSDGNGTFDAGTPRTVILARVIDNFDTAQDTTDTDLRIRLEIQAEYPVWVDSTTGIEITTNLERRQKAVRTILGRFWPGGQFAIRTDGDLDVAGDVQVCGECGSAHANGDIEFTGGDVCGEITASDSFVQTGGTVGGDKGLAPEIFIPTINPYDDEYVPTDPAIFATASPILIGPGSPPGTSIECPGPSATDPGASKYFAFVRASGANRTGQVWKAYRDFTNSRWYWRIIAEDRQGGSNFDLARLDNCGRVTQCDANIGCTPDKIYNGSVWNTAVGSVNDGNNEFYGFSMAGNYGTNTCAGDNISSAVGNDWNTNDWPRVTNIVYTDGVATPTFSVGIASGRDCTASGGNPCPGVPPLPGVAGNGQSGPDNNADFITSSVLNQPGWNAGGNTVYMPLYGAVMWFYGHVDLGGNLSNIGFNDGDCTLTGGCTAGTPGSSESLTTHLENTWRASIIAFGHINLQGGVRYATPKAGHPYQNMLIAGRDINLGGNAGTFNCNSGDCDGTPTNTAAGLSGLVAMHEQLNLHGSPGVNGIVVIEDRVDCDNFEPSGGSDDSKVQGSGNLSVHYDCFNPPDPWRASGVQLREWEEVLR